MFFLPHLWRKVKRLVEFHVKWTLHGEFEVLNGPRAPRTQQGPSGLVEYLPGCNTLMPSCKIYTLLKPTTALCYLKTVSASGKFLKRAARSQRTSGIVHSARLLCPNGKLPLLTCILLVLTHDTQCACSAVSLKVWHRGNWPAVRMILPA